MFLKITLAAIYLQSVAKAWSVPGLIPKNYEKKQQLDIFVGQLFSERTSFTFDYFTLNWCKNTKGVGYDIEKIGVTKTGAEMHETAYEYVFD